MDIAEIGIRADTSSLSAGEAKLKSFAREGAKAEASINKSTKSMSTGFDEVAAGASKMPAAIGSAARDTGLYAAQARGATMQTANLAAQFNDIGVMLAAGQSPLQLAMQQGTQINQVFTQMGGGVGAIKALGPAFMSIISPLSLATIGIIAGGAALVQWAMSSGDAEDGTVSLKDAISDLKDETRDAKDEVALFVAGLDNIAQLTVFNEILSLEREILSVRQMASEASGRTAGGLTQRANALQAELDALQKANDERQEAVDLADLVLGSLDAIERAESEIANSRALSREKAEDTLATLIQQNSIQAAINQYGEDSAEVASLRASAERDVFEEMLSTLDVSQDMKDELMGAFLVGQDLSLLDIGSGIRGATVDAVALAAQLGVSLDIASRMSALGNQGTKVYSGRGGDPRETSPSETTFAGFDTSAADKFLADLKKAPRDPRSGSGGKSEAEKAADEAKREAERQRNEDMRDAERIMGDLMDAQDLYNDALDQANRLYSAGVLPLDAYTDHVEGLRKELADAQWQDHPLSDIVDGFGEAVTGAENFRGILGSVKDAFLDNIKQMSAALISSGIQSGLMGLLGSSIGGIGGFGGAVFPDTPSFTGLYDKGGSIPSGGFGIVGERGPEFVMGPASVVGREDTAKMMGSSGNSAPVYNIDARGAQAGVADQIVSALRDYDARLPGRMRQLQNDPYRK